MARSFSLSRELRHNRFGEWWFRCRHCKVSYLPHFSNQSAALDRFNHTCNNKKGIS